MTNKFSFTISCWLFEGYGGVMCLTSSVVLLTWWSVDLSHEHSLAGRVGLFHRDYGYSHMKPAYDYCPPQSW